MGLSIYYSGRFKNASLSDMIDEVKDVAEIHKWNYHIFKTEFHPTGLGKDTFNQNIFGISFSPPDCEPIDITFLSNGIMSSPLHLQLLGNSKDKKNFSFTLCSKTQYAGFEAHKIIIDLFKYLSKKYFQEFKLTDESQYWESGDENILRENFKRYDDLMNQFSEGLENISVKENETIKDFVIRVSKILKFKRE